jgi:hypothetical protein
MIMQVIKYRPHVPSLKRLARWLHYYYCTDCRVAEGPTKEFNIRVVKLALLMITDRCHQPAAGAGAAGAGAGAGAAAGLYLPSFVLSGGRSQTVPKK